jgi:amino acid transporter
MRFLKDRFYSGLFTLLLGPFGFLGGLFVWLGLYWKILNIDLGLSLGYAVLTTVIIWIVIFIIRLKYFRQIPDEMTRDGWQDWKPIEENIKKDKLYLPPFWVGVLSVCIAFVVLAIVFKEVVTLVLIPALVIFSVFGMIWKDSRKRWSKMTLIEKANRKNDYARHEAEVKSQDKHVRIRVIILWCCVGAGLIYFGLIAGRL